MKKIIALSLFVFSSAGFAQDFLQFSPFSIQNYGGRIIDENLRNELNKSTFESESEENRSDDYNGSDLSLLNYSISKSRTRSNLQNFVSKTRAQNPAQADRMTELFVSTDVIGQIGGAMQSVGLNQSNAADAFALYWVSAWQASVGDTAAMSSQTYQAVAAQAARGLSLASFSETSG